MMPQLDSLRPADAHTPPAWSQHRPLRGVFSPCILPQLQNVHLVKLGPREGKSLPQGLAAVP